jgi:hypothetical protein
MLQSSTTCWAALVDSYVLINHRLVRYNDRGFFVTQLATGEIWKGIWIFDRAVVKRPDFGTRT